MNLINRARIRSAVPEAALERARLVAARRVEARLRRSATARGAALVFHSVGPRAGNAALELDPPVQVDRLDAAVGYLARRYRLVRAAELPSAVVTRKPGAALPIAATFDDDLNSHRRHAADVFKRHGAVATAFLCGTTAPFWWQLLQSAIDTRSIPADGLAPLDPALVARALARVPGALGQLAQAIEELDPRQRDRVTETLRSTTPSDGPMLEPADVAALVAAGWEIGFHTRRHDLLTTLGEDAMREALEDGREDLTGEPALTLAYPHGKATAREARAARDAGYVAAYTGRPRVFTSRTDPHQIGRLQPDTATLGRFALQLARALDVQ